MRRVSLIATLATAIGVAIALMPGHRGWFDVGVYYGAVHHWLVDRGALYDYVRPESTYGFTYPPFAAVVMAPMVFVGWHTAIAIHLTLTLAASAFLLLLLVDPIAKRHGWSRRFTLALAGCMFAMLSGVRDTVSFGQINLILVALVYLDLWLLERGHRLAGVGIGLAAAIKLTPAVFIVYLLVTKRWRAAWTAMGVVGLATITAAAIAPDASRDYFTAQLWDSGRVGSLEYISNQSLLGLVARLDPAQPNHFLWIGLAVAATVIWWRRVRFAPLRHGFALTGLASCLLSPITWVHHLVWTIPALVLLAEAALPLSRATRHRALAFALAYLLLASSLVWLWALDFASPLGFLGGNAYVLLTLAMLIASPTAPVKAKAKAKMKAPSELRPEQALSVGAANRWNA